MAAGAVAVPLDPQLPVSNIMERVSQCAAPWICISGIRSEKNLNPQELPLGDKMIFSENRGDWGTDDPARLSEYIPTGTGQDPAVILFSSGTTGVPKGAVLTHRAILANIDAIIDYMKPDSADIFYIIKTMTHTATLTGEILAGLRAGAGLIARNPVVPPTAILKRIEDLKPTILFANPSLLRILLQVKSGRYDLASIRTVYTSGSVASRELIEETRAFFPRAVVLNVYGLTEAGPRVIAQRADRGTPKPGSVGQPIRGVEVAIKSRAGSACAPNETGRIYVKTPGLMLGYWNDPKSTAEKIKEGWLDTGDLGYRDEDGDIFVVGRADEVILRGAHNVDPYRVENVIQRIPGIANCLVFGIPDPVHGSRIVCAIQKEQDTSLERQKIMAHCAEHLAPYECPQVICEWTAFPMTASGKLSRRLAVDYYLKNNT